MGQRRKIKKMPEQQNIEYKQIWHDDYLKWVCGFANAIGGTIYIGIDDKGNVTHLADYAKLPEDIPNKIRNAMGIICDVQLEDKQGKKYISIKVNPYSVAVSLRGRYYYRMGSTKIELTGVENDEYPGAALREMLALNKALRVTDEGGAIGGAIEQFVTKFGTLASRKMADSEKNKEILSNNSGLFLDYFRSVFGINSERFGKVRKRVRKDSRKASGKPLPNWFLLLELITIYPNVIADDISQIIGISERTFYKKF